MERKDFLKIFGGFLSIPLVPAVLIGREPEKPKEDPVFHESHDVYAFLKDSEDWLSNWIKDAVPCDNYEGMQIFKTAVQVSSCLYNVTKKGSIPGRMLLDHVYELLYTAVFGVGFVGMESGKTCMNENAYPEGSGIILRRKSYYSVRRMSGFVEQKGRYPTKHDKVRFVYLAGNGIKRFMSYSYGGEGTPHLYLSECRIEIL